MYSSPTGLRSPMSWVYHFTSGEMWRPMPALPWRTLIQTGRLSASLLGRDFSTSRPSVHPPGPTFIDGTPSLSKSSRTETRNPMLGCNTLEHRPRIPLMRFQSASSMLISRKRNLHLSDASPQVLYMPSKSSAVPSRRGDSPGGESPCWLRHATNSAVKKPSFSAESLWMLALGGGFLCWLCVASCR